MDETKTCVICGEPLSRYGNKVCSEGAICRDCVRKASEWLDDGDYQQMSADDFRQHLQYREANKEVLKAFKADRSVAGKYALYLDDNRQQFVFSRRKDYKRNNDDAAAFGDITQINIFEQKYMDTEDVDILFDVQLDNRQVNNMKFRVNEFPGLERGSDDYQKTLDLAFAYLQAFQDIEGIDFEKVEGESE